MPQINQFVYIDKMVNTSAFTYFSQIRVLNEESAYISPTNGKAAVTFTTIMCPLHLVCKS